MFLETEGAGPHGSVHMAWVKKKNLSPGLESKNEA